MIAGDVLLIADLMPAAIADLRTRTSMLDGRLAASRAALIAEHRDRIRAIATHAHTPCPRALIEALPRLEIIACFSAGVDDIDVAAAAEHGVVVTSTSEALADDVADVAMAKCLLLLRRFLQADRFVRDGSWARGPFPLARSLKGQRLGLLGMGMIGGAIARRAEASGMSIAYTTRTLRPDLPYRHVPRVADLAGGSDILVVCCPATAATRHLVDAAVLRALGPQGYLVNVARGSIVDEAALVEALREGAIAGAGLDVFADEPHPHAELLLLDNVSLSPHIGSGTEAARAAMGRSMVESILRQLGGSSGRHRPPP
ncbi:MAG: 2-hydroxyacid dehydrogenase [Rhodospirillales bacterium]|nr:2-hydroxyacid dehydrogenase [Rhodospirillales bacterium]